MSTLGGRLKKAADLVGGLDRLAELVPGISRRSLTDYVSDKSEPRASVINSISLATKVDAGWLITGRGAEYGSLEFMLRQRDQHSSVPIEGPNFIWLPRLDIEASAGDGISVDSEYSVDVIAFDRQFLRDKGAVPDQCKVIQARGDSMAPTIPDGSLLIVDHSQVEISNGFISVISIDNDLLVKRIRRRLDGIIDLISDNPAYPPESITKDRLPELRVIGRVVYFCRTP